MNKIPFPRTHYDDYFPVEMDIFSISGFEITEHSNVDHNGNRWDQLYKKETGTIVYICHEQLAAILFPF